MIKENKQFTSNTIYTVINLIIQMGMSFFLTSYLVNTVGSTEYGFFTMANNVVNYALIIANALNSLAARFVGIGIHAHDTEKAKRVFSSVFAGNVIFIAIALVPSSWAILHLESFIKIPPELVSDVKLLFVFVFINLCLNVIFAVFGSVYTIYNRLDLAGGLQAFSNIVKAALLIAMYIRFEASVVYLGFATLVATFVVVCGNIHYTRKYMPKRMFSISLIKISTIIEIVSSGVWNSINQLGVTLLNGLGVLIANIAVSEQAMGYLSVASMLPGVVSMCISTLSNLFTPTFLKLYAEENYTGLLVETKKSIRFMTVISAIPIAFLISFGIPFIKLWTPNTDIHVVYVLSILTLLPNFTGGAINSMNYLYTVANKVKCQALVLLGTGVINVILVFILLNTTNLGVYAVAGVAAVLGFVRNFVFNAPYAAYCIKQPYYIFWLDMGKSVICLIVVSIIGVIINHILKPESWIMLIISAIVFAIISLIILVLLLLRKEERQEISNIILKKLKR